VPDLTGADPTPEPRTEPGTGRVVLVVDDDANVREVLRRYLTRAGHQVVEAEDGASGLNLLRRRRPDLVILDLMMPGMDGLDVCSAIRRESDVPIILLTALGSESDRVVGLEHGADDYVVKPFSPREVTLRVSRILARTGPTGGFPGGTDLVDDGDLVVNMRTSRSVTRQGRPVTLTTREFDLLAFLVRHPEQAFSRTELMQRVWQWSFGDESTVTVHARRLREKIETDPANPVRLQTVWGHGYRYHALEPCPGEEPT